MIRVSRLVFVCGLLLLAGCIDGDQSAQDASSPSVTGSGTPTAPQSPAPTTTFRVGGLAYVGTDGALWFREEDGETTQLYMPNNGHVYWPEWSKDGSKIAFSEIRFVSSDERPQVDWADVASVVALDASGRELTRVSRALMPHWSPDSSKLSLMSEPHVRGDLLYSTPSIIDLSDGVPRPLSQPMPVYDAPRWDPSGEHLAMATGDTGLALISLDGKSQPSPIVSGANIYYLAPIWSDNSTLLAFERDRSGPTTEDSDSYVIADPVDGITHRVREGNPDDCGRELWLRDHEARWIPGTSLAAWTTGCHTGAERPVGIWLKDMLGPDERLLDVSGVVDRVGFFDVSPDGKMIAFTESTTGLGIGSGPFINPANAALFTIYAIPVAEGPPELLLTRGMQPAWRPAP